MSSFLARAVPGLLLLASVAVADEPASWYEAKLGSVEVHVPAVVEAGERTIKVQEFAPAAGKAWAKAHESPLEYVVIPVRVFGVGPIPRTARLTMLCGRKRVEMVAWVHERDASPDSGASYQALALFPGWTLRDVTGFEWVYRDTLRMERP